MSNTYALSFNADDSVGPLSVGPDGPWNVLMQAVDYPDQYVALLPSLGSTSLLIQSGGCDAQGATCPLPIPSSWYNGSGAYAVSGREAVSSAYFNAASLNDTASEPLRLQGQIQYGQDRFTLYSGGYGQDGLIIDTPALTVATNITATFPGNTGYMLDTGFFSLNAASSSDSWIAWNGSTVTFPRTLALAALNGNLASTSYGLHLGSASPNVSGSLVLGGYDSSRCITAPYVSNSDTVELADISLGVAQGAGAYHVNNTDCSGVNGGLLQTASGQFSTINVMPNPGVPYMYLPQQTCDAIAKYLPVTFSSDLGLYLWDQANNATSSIISSPHYLRFSFASSSQSSNIDVPFALLNLTLEWPIVQTPTQYFPCSPYTPSDGATYHLGRAFLQSAFLAQNFNTSSLMLAQAPGPGFQPQSIKSIGGTDTNIVIASNLPTWEDSWSGELTALSGSNQLCSQVTQTSPQSTKSSGAISGGAIAGIVVGVIAILTAAAISAIVVRRRRRPRRQTAAEPRRSFGTSPSEAPAYEAQLHNMYDAELAPKPYTVSYGTDNVAAEPKPVEVEGTPIARELEGSQPYQQRYYWD